MNLSAEGKHHFGAENQIKQKKECCFLGGEVVHGNSWVRFQGWRSEWWGGRSSEAGDKSALLKMKPMD